MNGAQVKLTTWQGGIFSHALSNKLNKSHNFKIIILACDITRLYFETTTSVTLI